MQSNKVKDAVETFDVIQTIDREKIVRKITEFLKENPKKMRFFVQVNVENEPQKNGLKIEELNNFLEWCKNDMKSLFQV